MSEINNASKGKGTIPEKGSSQWKTNEKIINSNPALRAARDTSEGFKPGSGISTGVNDKEYKAGYDKIQWTKPEEKEKPKFKVRINGVLQYPEDE